MLWLWIYLVVGVALALAVFLIDYSTGRKHTDVRPMRDEILHILALIAIGALWPLEVLAGIATLALAFYFSRKRARA